MNTQINTSGVVTWNKPGCNGLDTSYTTAFDDLSPFEQGYTRAGLIDISETIASGHEPGDRAPAFFDLAPETLALILKDCAEITALIPGLDARDGRDIWRARAKHFPGAGTVTEYMRAHFPPLTPTLADDGKVYLRSAA